MSSLSDSNSYGQVGFAEDAAPKKKKSSIFGVAKLIRKASSKKKSSKKGISLDDNNNGLFEDPPLEPTNRERLWDERPLAQSRSAPVAPATPPAVFPPAEPKAAPSPENTSKYNFNSGMPMPPPLIDSPAPPEQPPPLSTQPVSTQQEAVDPFNTTPQDNDISWDTADFFKADPFASFVDPNASGGGGEDAFGFPADPANDSFPNDPAYDSFQSDIAPDESNAVNTTHTTEDAVDPNADKVDGGGDAFASFDIAGDSWGEPQMLPVDFTPRRSNANNANTNNNDVSGTTGNAVNLSMNTTFSNPQFQQEKHPDDDRSFDASEMSEVTNPTFVSAAVSASAPKQEQEPEPEPEPEQESVIDNRQAGTAHEEDPAQELTELPMPPPLMTSTDGSKSRNISETSIENSLESTMETSEDINESAEGKNKQSAAVNESIDPPLEEMESDEDERDDSDQGRGTPTEPPPQLVAKSRILSKYAKSGRVRRQNAMNNTSLGSIHDSPMRNDKKETMRDSSSIMSTGTRSINSINSGNGRQERSRDSPVKTTKTATTASSEPTPVRSNGQAQRTPPRGRNRAMPTANDKQNQQSAVNTSSSSLSAYRRRRMSPTRQGTASSTAVTASPARSITSNGADAMGSPNRSASSLNRSPGRTNRSSPNRAGRNIGNQGSPSRGANANGKYSYSKKKKSSPSVVDNPTYYSMESRLIQIKDPIQRAGVRLLWAAAIPIQTQARRFLARQAAIKRMCAVLTMQAFVRRWLAERDLEIAIWSAIQIQAAFRGWFSRDSLEDNHYCATQIQRVVRGYLATMHVFEDLYSITIVQSVVRMHLAINVAVDRLSSVIAIQSWWRGVQTRDHLEEMEYSAVAVQSNWRRYLAQMSYQFDIIDIIIVQSIARRWRTCREIASVKLQCFARVCIANKRFAEKHAMHSLVERHTSATMIQARWRSYIAQVWLADWLASRKIQSIWRSWVAQMSLLEYVAATKLQAQWRGFVAQEQYLIYKAVTKIQAQWRRHVARDNYVVHTSVTKIQARWRGFLVQEQYLLYISARKIQSCWRSYTAQVHMLISIVNVIVIQSLWRRRVAMKLYKPLLNRIKLAKERKRTNSATLIQSRWRGFVIFSTYLIKRYENKAATTIQAYWRGYMQSTNYSIFYCDVVRIQAFVRGYQERSWHSFQSECAIIIQAASRRYLARKECHNECMVSILIAAAANSLRVRNAAKRLQQWWLGELWERREKQAALIIERFFIYVKREVEKEVKALKKKKKERRRRRKIKQSDEYILERAWLGVADDVVPDVPAAVPQRATAPRYPQADNGSVKKEMYNRYDRYRGKGVIHSVEEDAQSEVSGLTDLDFGYRNNTRRLKKSQKEIEEDASLENAFRETEAQIAKGRRSRGVDDYGGGSVQKSVSRRGHAYPRRYDR